MNTLLVMFDLFVNPRSSVMAVSSISCVFLRLSQRQLQGLYCSPCMQAARCFSADKGGMPKRPLTPYIAFAKENYLSVKNANPGLKVTEISKLTGSLWRHLDQEKKDLYYQNAKDEREFYTLQREEYLASLSKEEIEHMKEEQRQKRHKLAARRKKMELKKLGKPVKGAITAFSCFVQSSSIDRGEAPITSYMRGLAEHWKMMPIQDKEPYEKQATENRNKYTTALQQWEAEMLEAGKEELVRGYKKPKPKSAQKKKRKVKTKAAKSSKKGKKSAKKSKTSTKPKTSRTKETKNESTQTDPNPQWMREE